MALKGFNVMLQAEDAVGECFVSYGVIAADALLIWMAREWHRLGRTPAPWRIFMCLQTHRGWLGATCPHCRMPLGCDFRLGKRTCPTTCCPGYVIKESEDALSASFRRQCFEWERYVRRQTTACFFGGEMPTPVAPPVYEGGKDVVVKRLDGRWC